MSSVVNETSDKLLRKLILRSPEYLALKNKLKKQKRVNNLLVEKLLEYTDLRDNVDENIACIAELEREVYQLKFAFGHAQNYADHGEEPVGDPVGEPVEPQVLTTDTATDVAPIDSVEEIDEPEVEETEEVEIEEETEEVEVEETEEVEVEVEEIEDVEIEEETEEVEIEETEEVEIEETEEVEVEETEEVEVEVEETEEVEIEVEETEEVEIDEEEEEEEQDVFEIEYNGTRYYTTDETNGAVYAVLADDDIGDQIGEFQNGVLVMSA